MAIQTLFDLINCLFISELAVHEAAAARLLHHLGPVVAGDLAEALAAVDDRVVDDLRIGQQETAVGCWGPSLGCIEGLLG